MKREHGYTLIETLVAMSIIMLLSAAGMSGWQSWQQQQRLWQTAWQVRDFLLLLRDDANWHNREHTLKVLRDGADWCLYSSISAQPPCSANDPFALRPLWPGVLLQEVTPALALFGLRDTAWPGHIRLKNESGSWQIVVSGWGRIRMCQSDAQEECP